jgi:MraZ protein
MDALNRMHYLQSGYHPAVSAAPSGAAAPAAVLRPAPLPLPPLVMSAGRKHASHGDQVPATGTYECSLEKQSELKLSAAARTELDRPRVLFVALAPDKKCLWVYTPVGVEHLAEQLEHSSGSDEVARCTRRKCFSRLQCVHATADGTFPLPAELVEVACLKGNVLMIGVRDHFELWDAHQWQQYIGQEEPAEPPASEAAPTAHPGYGLAPGAAPNTNEAGRAPGEVAVHYEIQERRPGNSASWARVFPPPGQARGPGRLRRAGFFVDGKQAYVLENSQGRPLLYVTAQAGLNLEPYVNRTVDLQGSVIYYAELRSDYMTATTVNLLQ